MHSVTTNEYEVMVDTIGADSANIPIGTKYVGAYASGLDDVPWTQADIARLKNTGSIILRIYQGAGTYPGVDGYDGLDVETGALTPDQAAAEIKKRVEAGYPWTYVYGSDEVLAATAVAIRLLGADVWNGHVYAFLANWNLSQTQAVSLLGTTVHGMTCVGVQWASDTSNPETLVPGTTGTLKSLNCDLSVVDPTRLPLPPKGGVAPPAPAPAPKTVTKVEVTFSDGTTEVMP